MSAEQVDDAEQLDEVASAHTPPLGFSRLLLVATGAISAADLPFWGTWMRMAYPRMQTRLVLTPSAKRFVTRDALHGRITGDVLDDAWPEDDSGARHVQLAEWAQAALVYPATFDFTARLALGRANSPALLALQCTTAPVAVAPALPPGGFGSPAFQQHLRALSDRRNVEVVPPQSARSITTGRQDAYAPAMLPDCLAQLEALRVRLGEDGGAGSASEATR